MRKVVVFVILLALLTTSLPAVSAQDGNVLAACSEEELSITTDALSSYADGLVTLMTDYDLSGDPTDAAYGETLVALDAASYEYWNTVYPALPECEESQALAFVIGAVYDEYLTIGLLSNLAGWADAADMTEDAQTFADQASTRLDELNSAMEDMGDVSLSDLAAALAGEMLPGCSEEEVTALLDGMSSGLDDMSTALDELGDDPVAAFAFTEGVAYTFDSEVFDQVSTCAENQALAWIFDLALNDINIIAGLYANAAVEEAAGNTDVAETLTASADQRYEDFQSDWDTLSEMMTSEE